MLAGGRFAEFTEYQKILIAKFGANSSRVSKLTGLTSVVKEDDMVDKERFPTYLDNVMSRPPKVIRAELDRLMTKIVDAQNLSCPSSPIGKILFSGKSKEDRRGR